MDNARWETVESPWGAPSDQLRRGEIDGLPVVFLPRHGRGHRVPPSAINYRANIDCLKRAGVTDLVSVSACGSDAPDGAGSSCCACTARVPFRSARFRRRLSSRIFVGPRRR